MSGERYVVTVARAAVFTYRPDGEGGYRRNRHAVSHAAGKPELEKVKHLKTVRRGEMLPDHLVEGEVDRLLALDAIRPATRAELEAVTA